MIKRILLCMPNGLVADGIEGMLHRKNQDIKITVVSTPYFFENSVELYKPDVVIIEVKDTQPYTALEWEYRILRVKNTFLQGKVAMLVNDDNYPQIIECVKEEKKKGIIDAFFYTSSGLNYLTDAIESL